LYQLIVKADGFGIGWYDPDYTFDLSPHGPVHGVPSAEGDSVSNQNLSGSQTPLGLSSAKSDPAKNGKSTSSVDDAPRATTRSSEQEQTLEAERPCVFKSTSPVCTHLRMQNSADVA
jgi:hypothetical protein